MFWAESTNLLVIYQDWAVFNAVSAFHLRQPCVAIKYSRVVNHSLRFDLIGNSIVLPDGDATNHLVQQSCVNCHQFHLAHESTILNKWFFTVKFSFNFISIVFLISDHTQIVWVYLSSSVINQFHHEFWICLISSSPFSIKSCLSSGTIISSFDILIHDIVEYLYQISLILFAKKAVSSLHNKSNALANNAFMRLFQTVLLINHNSLGIISLNLILQYVVTINSESNLNLIGVCSQIIFAEYANSRSSILL